MGANGDKKAKRNFTAKFAKPKPMKPTDYHSSSSDDEEEEISAGNLGGVRDDSRLSDDSEHNFSDDDDAEVEQDDAEGSSDEELEFDDEVSDDQEDEVTAKIAAKSQQEVESDDAAEDDDDDADGEDDSDDDAQDDDGDAEAGNANWAKSLAKILKQEKPKNKKIVALSKAKKTSDILEAREKAKAIGFAIDGEIKEEKPDTEQLDADIAEQKRKKKAAFNLRIKPTLMDRDRERAFKKIATKGVVQLFNAVRTQQKDLSAKLEQAGRLDHRRDAVLNNINKRKFLDVLMGGKRAKSENVDNPVKDEVKDEDESDMDDMDDEVYNDGLPKNSIWSVLKDDFLSNKKMSHWDKDEEEDEPLNTDGEEEDDDE